MNDMYNTACRCNPCAGASCTCGCQAVPATCGAACGCGCANDARACNCAPRRA